jgi:hypothetical protein
LSQGSPARRLRRVPDMLLPLATLALLLAHPATGLAAGGKGQGKRAGTKDAPAVSAPRPAEKAPPVLKLDPLTIEGRIAKPKAIYSLQRAAPAFSELVPEESFVPRILESVEEDPF